MRPLRIHFLLRVVLLVALSGYGDVTAQEKAPVPDAEAQAAAKKTAAEIYGNRFADAKKADEKTALAEEIIEAALKVQNGLPGQFVLLTIARDVAAGAGDAVTALKAVDELAKRFEVPAATMQGETLLTAAREASATAQRKAVAEAVSDVIEALASEGEYELALKICSVAHSAATRSREYALARELAGKEDELKRGERDSRGYREALSTLDENPIDPEANLAAGRYLCFVQNDWQWGVPMLALGNDAELQAVAANDLRGSDSAEGQVALGDAWWELAESIEGAERQAMQLRAGSWYRQAEPRLAGNLQGLRIKQRLEEIANLGREVPKLSRAATSSPPPPLAIAPFDEETAKRHQTAWAEYLQLPVVHTNSIGMKFVLIPPGEFEFLAKWDQDGPRVKLTRPFYLGQCEVTQEQYFRIMGTNPSWFKGEPTRPVEEVRWTWAVDFCRRLSALPQERTFGAVYRLPTEAEWEYACRAGATPRERVGEYAPGVLGQYAWHKENSDGQTQPVGQLKPNAWGLFDIRGNVGEWLADWYVVDQAVRENATPEDPQGPASGTERVLRGGSIRGGPDDGFIWLWRDHAPQDKAWGHDKGFRVVMLLTR